jgi:acyl-coenzyme A thioesterase PaaI-like protein
MTPGGEPGVSDFGISSGEPPSSRSPGPSGHGRGEDDDPRFALAAAVRRVTALVVGANVPDEEIRAATTAVDELADALAAAAGPGRRPRSQPDPLGHPQDFFPTSPVIGFANPVAPPVQVEVVDGELRGTATFDDQYEGPPACVHGGVIALVFDEMLGAANIAAGQPGMTGTLTVRYRRPTPIRTPLRLEAAFVSRERRKITTRGAMYHGDELTAEAEGIFIELIPERFIEVVGRHGATAEVMAQIRADAQRHGIGGHEAPPGPDS